MHLITLGLRENIFCILLSNLLLAGLCGGHGRTAKNQEAWLLPAHPHGSPFWLSPEPVTLHTIRNDKVGNILHLGGSRVETQ